MTKLYSVTFLLPLFLASCQEVNDKAIESRHYTIKIPTVENLKGKEATDSTANKIHTRDSLK